MEQFLAVVWVILVAVFVVDMFVYPGVVTDPLFRWWRKM